MRDTEFQEIQDTYRAYCSSIVSRILPDHRDQEECINDVWLKAWQSMNKHQPSNMKGWLGAIARNCALTRLRQVGRQNERLEETAAELTHVLQNSPAEQMESKLLGEAISDFLNVQPKQDRVVFVRRYWYADSVEEAAHHVGWTVSKTKTVLFRTRMKLREYLIKEGLYHE